MTESNKKSPSKKSPPKKFIADCNGIADIIFDIHKENHPDDYEYLEKEYCLDFKNYLTKKGKFWFITKNTLNQLFDNISFTADKGDTISDFYMKRKYKKPNFNINITGGSYDFKTHITNPPIFPDLMNEDDQHFLKKKFNFSKTQIYQYLSPLLKENSPNITPNDFIKKTDRTTLRTYIILHLLIIYDNLKEPFSKKLTIAEKVGGKTKRRRPHIRKHNRTISYHYR